MERQRRNSEVTARPFGADGRCFGEQNVFHVSLPDGWRCDDRNVTRPGTVSLLSFQQRQT